MCVEQEAAELLRGSDVGVGAGSSHTGACAVALTGAGVRGCVTCRWGESETRADRSCHSDARGSATASRRGCSPRGARDVPCGGTLRVAVLSERRPRDLAGAICVAESDRKLEFEAQGQADPLFGENERQLFV